jgi:hypothetical protein
MRQWIEYHLDHLFSFCCLWYPFVLMTDGLEFSSDDGLCSGSTFSAGPSCPNGKLVEKFCALKEITASSCCLRVLCSWKILWTLKQHCINLGSYGKYIGLMVQKLAGTPTWPVAAFPHSSSLSFHCLFHAPNQAAACSSVKLKMSLSMQSQQPAIDGCSLDHTYKLCWLASSRTGRPALAQNKSRSLQVTSSIHCSLSEGSTHQIAHEEGVTLFDCTTMLPSI